MVLVTVLGGGGSYPPPGDYGPGVLVDTGEARVLLDCGEGCVASLQEAGYGPCDPDLVYVSHVHIDHWSGLPSLAVARIAEGCPSLSLRAHPEVLALLELEARVVLPSSLELEVKPIEKGEQLGIIRLEVFPVSHSVVTYGARVVAGDVVVAYTSDTRLRGDLYKHLLGSSILLAEATLPSRLRDIALKEGHMTVADFLALIRDANPGVAVAVHLSPESRRELVEKLREGPPRVVIGRRGLQVSA